MNVLANVNCAGVYARNNTTLGQDSDSYPCRLGPRFAFIVSASAALLLLRCIDPVLAGSWLPFHPSCGAITGLPCIFCGMTRALHLLLNGDFIGAIYFNWLSFPFLGVGARFIARFAPGGVHATSRSELTNVRTGNVPPSHGITARFVC